MRTATITIQPGESRVREYAPLAAANPLVSGSDVATHEICPACGVTFKSGDHIALIALGPGVDATQRSLALAGLPYLAVALAVHLACGTGRT